MKILCGDKEFSFNPDNLYTTKEKPIATADYDDGEYKFGMMWVNNQYLDELVEELFPEKNNDQ